MTDQELAMQIAALRGQLPQWNPDAAWARDMSMVFGSHSADGRANLKGMDAGLSLKEQEAERLEEIRHQMLQQRRR
jgi:hypothetical protein